VQGQVVGRLVPEQRHLNDRDDAEEEENPDQGLD